ncbi:MAG: SAM-dependent DNA methyltransferase, partial [Bacteroidia bacterium]|nr:SAM-dependent DNA methyltransferase [Bacteroidia bacterium]
MQIERQLQGTLNTIFTEEIKSRRLENRIFPYSVQEEGRADITLKNSKGRQIFFIELKDPTAKDGRSIFDSNVLQRELERAQLLEIDYFGVCNFTAAALLDTKKMYEKNAVTEGFFTVAEIARLSVNYVPTNEIQRKLRIIANFYLDCAVEIIERKTIKFTPIDELFIFKIRNLIEIYAYGITENVWEKYKSNKQFKKEISDYAGKQHWSIPNTYEEIENITYISLLMLISKLIFYKTYNDKNIWKGLSPIIIDDDIDTAKKLEEILWDYFHEFMKITSNFELLIGIRDDIIFRIPFVSDNSIELVRSVINAGAYYNFSDAKYDVIGRIFEELIHEDERHKLGQYFTPPNVVDLINTFAIRSGREKIFDPSCGSGTFLVRAYERKKKLNPKMHSALLEEIYGNDVSDYPAYLSMLNLAVRNISKHSYPKIIHSDFFSIVPSVKLELLNQRGEKQRRYLPQFDAIIGNPPYTRQEDIGSLQGLVSKDTIQNLIKTECGFTPSQRTSIYVYFFYHVAAFLKEGGYLAYICSNSWLDVDYGTDLQQWMLRHFEIVAIMDSEVERFFPAASVNTSIVILRKCKDEDKRNSNTVKFIYFKANLADILKKYKNADTLIAIFEKADNTIENDFFKITCIEQKELLNESKWGIFLKAPDVYFDILKKGKGKLKILGTKKGIANIFYGLKTGCNEFFYIKDITKTSKNNIVFSIVNNIEKFRSIAEIRKNNLRIVQNGLNEIWLIENDFVKPAIKTTKEINSYWIDKVSEENHLLSVGLIENYYNKKKKEYDITKYRRDLKENYPYLFSYIVYGEKNKTDDVIISEKPTCKSRPAWWDLGIQNKKDFILLQFRDKRNWTPIIKKQILIGNVVFIGNYQNKSNSHIYNVS